MKKFTALLVGLLSLPAFAEVAPVGYYDEPALEEVVTDEEFVAEDEDFESEPAAAPVRSTTLNTRAAIGRAATRAIPSGTAAAAPRGTVAARPVASRTTVSANSARGVATGVASRAGNASNTSGVTARRGASASGTSNVRAGTLDAASGSLYSGTTTGRVAVRTSGVRTAAVRSAVSDVVSSAVPTATGSTMDEIAQLTDFCKAQYTQCMDNFCNILDDNQGRCSCSSNLKNYAKSEKGLKDATEDLQKVANDIKYIGLTKEEVLTLFTQTEAEQAMQGKTDNSQLKTSLDRVSALIFDVKTGTAISDAEVSSDLSGMLNFNLDSGSGFDLSSFLGGTGSGSNASISNQRGLDLYKTAAARCKVSVLDTCKRQGVDTAILTNSYDLEIDKQCVAYERNLDDANAQMVRTVNNAKQVLKQARLVVAQQKNAYADIRSCINALDSCMQDDFVCGGDYENCLDPTGKYIVNGKIVSGSVPGKPGSVSTTANADLSSTWIYSQSSSKENAWSSTGSISDYITANLRKAQESSSPTSLVQYLQNKIGYIDSNNIATGMCVPVLNKCQRYTYTSGTSAQPKFQADNNVVKEYMNRTLTNIRARQNEIVAKYAEDCKAEVLSCLASNSSSSYYSSSNTTSELTSTPMNACRTLATTCNSALNGTTGESAENGFMKTIWAMQSSSGNTLTYVLNGGAWKDGLQPPYSYDTTDNKYTILITTGTYPNYLDKPKTDTGAAFGGWFTSNICDGTATTEMQKGMTGSLTLYAKWTSATNCVSPLVKGTGCSLYCK